MRILTAKNQAELTVKRSRFIAELQTVATQEEAREALRARKEFWGAQGITHLVQHSSSGRRRMSSAVPMTESHQARRDVLLSKCSKAPKSQTPC